MLDVGSLQIHGVPVETIGLQGALPEPGWVHGGSYYLLLPTIRAYLTWLEHGDVCEHVVEGRVAKWRLR